MKESACSATLLAQSPSDARETDLMRELAIDDLGQAHPQAVQLSQIWLQG